MKSLDIKYVYAQNFLCFGPDSFKMELGDKGRIVLVKGLNLDVCDDESKTASNGSGKSSIPEIIVYTLFGKTIKHPKKISHGDVINNQVGKGLKTEVRWGDFRVLRTRKPDSLRMWESREGVWDDTTEITLGGQPATQKLIEEKLGLNYETFVNVVVFTDNNSGSFLECDAASKRDIVENLLSLEKYKDFSEKAKELRREKKDDIKLAQREYESARQGLQQAESRMKASKEQESIWRDKRTNELEALKSKLKSLELDLSSTPEGEMSALYAKAQERIAELNSEISDLESKQIRVQEMLAEANDKAASARDKRSASQTELNESLSSIKSMAKKISEHRDEIERLERNEGATCKFCMGKISKDNYGKYAELASLKTAELKSDKETEESCSKKLSDEIKSLKSKEEKITDMASKAKSKLSGISSELSSKRSELAELNRVEKPKSDDLRQNLVKQQIVSVKDQISEKQNEISGESPFKKIVESLDKEICEKNSALANAESSLASLEKELPYYEFWSVAFGDSGIRKFVIDGIIPALNARIAYWLQFLIDGKIDLKFNNELEETIERNPSDGDPFVYYGMSGGEKRRLNLAVSQAFAHVMMLSSGTCPNVVFLDEVTTNIDQIGVVGVYNMIVELAKDRQVFITTHDQNLLELLDGCDLISLEKRKGFTRMQKS
jgi:DNA repair exonuclease SbcCD ATPase subunit